MSDGSVTIDVGLTLDELKKDLKNLKNIINDSLPSGNKVLAGLSNGFKSIGNLATSAGKICSTVTASVTGVFTAAAAKAKSFIEVYESAISVFERKLGKTGASQMYDSLLDIAKGSKYAQEYIVSAGQTLVAMGVEASDTAKYVQIATDAMSGMGKSGAEVQAMAEMFGKMAMQTTLYTEDLNQMLTAGIPVYDILATKYKTNTDKIKEMASAGKLTSKDFEYLTEVLSGNVEGMEEFSVSGLALAGKTGTLSGALDSMNSSFRTFALNLLDLDPRTESGKANIQKLQDVVGAFGAILEDVGTKFGFVGGWIKEFLDKLVTVEKTVDENGNTITKYGGYLGQLKEKLDSLTPEQLEKIAKTILAVVSAGPKLLILGKAFSVVSSVLNGLNTGVQTLKNIRGGIDKVSTAFKTLKNAGTFTKIATNAVKLLKVAFTALTSPVGLVILAITAAVATFVVLWNKCEGFRNFWINLWEIIKSSVETAKDFVVEKIQTIGEFFSKIPEKFGGIKQKVADFVSNFISTIKSLPTNLKNLIYNGIFALWDKIPEKFNSIYEAFAENVDSILGIVSSVFGAVTTTIKTAIFVIKSILTGNFGEAVEAVKSLFTRLGTIFSNIWGNIKSIFFNNIEIVVGLFKIFIENIVTFFSELPYKIGCAIGFIIGYFVNLGLELGNWITTELPQIIEGIITWFSELPGKIWEFLLDIINKVIEWGINTYNTANEWVNNTINSIVTFFSELPGKIWTFLVDTISKIKTWGQNAWENAKNYASRLVNSVTNFFSELPGKIWAHLTNTITKIIDWGNDMVAKGKEAATNLVTIVYNTIAELPGKVMDVGKNIVEGLWNGITGAGDWIKNKVGEFASGILDGMKEALGIHSPSRVFRDEVGKYIALGVGEGFMDNIASVYKKMKASVDFETQKISAKVSATTDLKTSKGNSQTITNNNDNGIQVNQHFYGKEQSPHENAKETRSALRRIAYAK